MRSRLVLFLLLTAVVLPYSTGCSIYRHASRPELWGMSLPETWEYDSLRKSGKSHSEARQIIWQRRNEPRATQDRELTQTQLPSDNQTSP